MYRNKIEKAAPSIKKYIKGYINLFTINGLKVKIYMKLYL